MVIFTLRQAMKTQKRSKNIAPLFLVPRYKIGVGSKNHAPADLPCEREFVAIAEESVWAPWSIWIGA
jgi:hypothetical protein